MFKLIVIDDRGVRLEWLYTSRVGADRALTHWFKYEVIADGWIEIVA